MALTDPLACGFAKIAVFEMLMEDANSLKTKGSDCKPVYENHVARFNGLFSSTIDIQTYRKKFIPIKEKMFQIGKTSTADKAIVLEQFGLSKWKSMSEPKKMKHTIFDCQGCLKNDQWRSVLSLLPINKKDLKAQKRAREGGLFRPCKEDIVKETAERVRQLNREYRDEFGTTFDCQYRKCKGQETKAVVKKTIIKEVAQDIEKQTAETACTRVLGTNISLTKHNDARLLQSFEPSAVTKERTEKQRALIRSGKQKRHDHVGNVQNYVFDIDGCVEEVDSLEEGAVLNFSKLARDYGLQHQSGNIPKNGGQIVKEMLGSKIDLNRFEKMANSGDRYRKKKRKILNSSISVPMEESSSKLKEKLRELVLSGEYEIGELIVPQVFEKTSIDSNGDIKIEEFETEGRKFPLKKLREKLLKKLKPYMRLLPDEFYENANEHDIELECSRLNISELKSSEELKHFNRNRMLACWHDTSVVSNASHFLVLINCLYDEALFYTNEEYLQKTGMLIDIAEKVETPELYILARCPSNDQQLMYSETRLEDILEMNDTPLEIDGCQIQDTLRIFKGDAPACQLECGHKKGGHYFCWFCVAKSSLGYNLQHILFAKLTTLSDKCELLRSTVVGRQLLNSGAFHYTDTLKKADIIGDLHERGVKGWREAQPVEELRSLLNEELKGTHRLPALLFEQPKKSLFDVGLELYEVLPVEPLHTISGHIKNLYEELPRQMNKKQRKLFESYLEAVFAGKQVKRGSDYRKSLVELTVLLEGRIDEKFYVLIQTLCEIQEIFYSMERSPSLIFRLHNLVFLHAIALVDAIKETKTLTERKLFGQYFHSMVCHAPLQFRLFSLPSTNAEDEERMFNVLKTTATMTSNHHPDNVLANAFVRLQAREQFQEQKFLNKRKRIASSQISKSGGKLQKKTNTVIPNAIINAYPFAWQAHCERIADFLEESNIWEASAEGVTFHDLKKLNVKMNHFRSTSMSAESKRINDIWSNLVEKSPEKIPCNVVIINDEGEQKKINSLKYLKTNTVKTNLNITPTSGISQMNIQSPVTTPNQPILTTPIRKSNPASSLNIPKVTEQNNGLINSESPIIISTPKCQKQPAKPLFTPNLQPIPETSPTEETMEIDETNQTIDSEIHQKYDALQDNTHSQAEKENTVISIKRRTFKTKDLLMQVLEDKELAEKYEGLKTSKSIDLPSVIARIQVKLTCKWEKANSTLKRMKEEAIKNGEIAVFSDFESAKYKELKNTLTIIKKLQGKFNLVLK